MNLFRAFKLLSLIKKLVRGKYGDASALMGELHGLPQKIGQHLTLYQEDFGRFDAYFGTLCTQSRAENLDVRAAAGEFGLSPDRITLCAQASIGQVYKVETPDGALALKVQYPGVEARIRSDFRLLKGLLWPTRLLPLRNSGLLRALDNLRRTVLDECDYLREAGDQQEFHALFEQDERIYIPRIIAANERAIVSEWVAGTDLTQYPRRLDSWFISAYLAFILKSLKRLHKIHADPHPGNLFITGREAAGHPEATGCPPEAGLPASGQAANLPAAGQAGGAPQLAVLDFGAVARFTVGEAAAVSRLLLGGYGSLPELVDDLRVLGISEMALEAYRPVLGDLVSILLEPLYYPGEYDFMGWRLQYKMNTLLGSRAWDTPLEIPLKLMLLLRTLHGLYFYARKNFIVFNWHQAIKNALG